MSYQVANLNIGGLTVGQSSKITFGSIIPPSTIEQQMRPSANTAANLFLFNESGSGLKCLFPIAGETFTLAAGQWRVVSIPPNETQLTFTILYILANAPVTQLLADLYIPGEAIDAIGVLGNSPIGLSAVTLPVTQVIQDGQPTGQTILEATPSGLPQKLLMTTDGNFILGKVLFTSTIVGAGNMGSVDWESNLVVYRTPEVGATAQSHVFQVWDGSLGQNAFEVGRESSPTSLTNVGSLGQFSRVAGQATAGSFGVPLNVAQALGVSVTVTTLQTILTYTPAATGFFRINGYVNAGNATTPQLLNFIVTYTDPDGSVAGSVSLATTSAGALQVMNGSTNIATGGGNAPYAIISEVIHAKASTAITVKYQDPGGTPADHITAFIEQLA